MYDTFVRTAKPWAVRYLLEDAQGAVGSPCAPDDHTASRYLEMRASSLSDYFFKGLKKNSIGPEEWYDNYDDTEKIPSVFPSIGYWNVINGATGIGVALSSNVPQFNLKEVNAALVKLIQNPDISFDEIYCAPDFATGGTILNAAEVKESIRKGRGAAIRLRANLEYQPKENVIIATQLPYGVYTNTVCKQLEELTSEDEDYGIAKIIDHTKKTADIRIYLSKNANPGVMMKKLYKDTSLENYFSVNMVMLDYGRFPKVFGWKEACQAYIDHIRACKRREIQYDLDVLAARNHILDGLKIAIANIDEVVKLIRSSSSPTDAKTKLKSKYLLDDDQAKAILDMKLQRLANLEAVKINTEYDNNVVEMNRLGDILNTQSKLDDLLIAALNEVANKFGDARRTRLRNDMGETEEEIEVYLTLTKSQIKVADEKTPKAHKVAEKSCVVIITDDATMYRIPVSEIMDCGTIKVQSYLQTTKKIVFMDTLENIQYNTYWIFATKNKYVKKSLITEYNYLGRGKATKVMRLKDGDSIEECAVFPTDEGIFHKKIVVSAVPTSGKMTLGVKYEQGLSRTPYVCAP